MPPITVFVADSEKRRSELCLRLLGAAKIRVVGTARTAKEAIVGAALKPQVLLFDLKINRSNAVPALMLIRARIPHTKVILLTGRSPDTQILEAISQGARGYLDQTIIRRFLVKAVRVVNAGESWVPRAMVAKIIDRLARLNPQKARLPKR
ncbi:MAG: response regulator [Nitrospiraceae bacterium]